MKPTTRREPLRPDKSQDFAGFGDQSSPDATGADVKGEQQIFLHLPQ